MNLVGKHRSFCGSVPKNHTSTHKLLGAAIVVVVLCRLAAPSFAQSVVLSSGGVVDFNQLNYGDLGSANFGAEGVATLDVTNALALLPGGNTSGGYLNVVDGSGNWLVQNMPVLPTSVTGSDSLSMTYDIAGITDGTQVSSENLRAVLSTSPQLSAPGGTTSAFPISEVTEDYGGAGTADTAGATSD